MTLHLLPIIQNPKSKIASPTPPLGILNLISPDFFSDTMRQPTPTLPLPGTPPLPTSLDQVPLPDPLPPLVITAFTRPDLLTPVLDGIRQQTLLPPRMIAFLDGARHERDEPLIQDCVALLNGFSTTVPVEIVRRSRNLGCDQNVITGFTEVFRHHEALVYLEDDDVPNPHFFDRLCRLLAAYQPHPQVCSVSAYANFPEGLADQIDTDFMVSRRVFSWGFGIWRDRWQSLDLANRPGQFNPFGSFYQIPATEQTKLTLVNQFWLEHNHKTDWVITLTLAAFHANQVHITPLKSFVNNIGFGHPQSETYRKSSPDWVNAHYDAAVHPDLLPPSLELHPQIQARLSGWALARHLAQASGLWLHPRALWHFLTAYPDWRSLPLWLGLFLRRSPQLWIRWRSGRSV
ncbi:MAG: hypothetical protein VKK04_14750 [Synechococcales bacterium]|nr:hypothetical protein [Synechococcales bacterium]